jgi:hypothetical protein
VVARSIVDRLADELVAMARAMIRQLRLGHLAPEVALAGGVFRADDADFEARIAAGVRAIAPGSSVRRAPGRPVLGAALLALDRLGGATPGAEARVRAELGAWDGP